jgi:hypothetical protein
LALKEHVIMEKLSKFELLALKAYLELPVRKLLNHQFELEEDYIAEHVMGFIRGERFDKEFTAFSKEELEIINPIISKNISNDDGKDLLTAFLLTKLVCNIMNKYKK